MVDGMVRAKKNIQKIIRQLKFQRSFAADNDDSDYFPELDFF
jgi:hypothetical protein